MNNSKVLLCILDGWGIGEENLKSNAIFAAKPSYYNTLLKKYPHNTLVTHGTDVGLPEGQMGNSEVGHLNIGAGRIVYQDLEKIDQSIKTKEFFNLDVLKNAFAKAKNENIKLHLMGLVSDGGVHSHINHLKALMDMALDYNLQNDQVLIHAISDGRDCDPKSGLDFCKEIDDYSKKTVGTIATLCGRYYAMDRDKRWERVKEYYDLIVHSKGEMYDSVEKCFEDKYAKGETDEFIKPVVFSDKNIKIENGDIVICFNFRTDRCREITEVLTQKSYDEWNMHPLDLHYITMTRYEQTYKNIQVVFEKDDLKNTLGEVLSYHSKSQVRAAETEKYPHVTFFFSGGNEKPFPQEERILVPSPKVATYDLQPEMSAVELQDKVNQYMEKNTPDFVCVNFANPDMVGHTGVFESTVQAIKTVDVCLENLIEKARKLDYHCLVIADHGNAEKMINEDGSPYTAHTTNPVNCILISHTSSTLQKGKLADIAPTILDLMQIEAPTEMTGKSLLTN